MIPDNHLDFDVFHSNPLADKSFAKSLPVSEIVTESEFLKLCAQDSEKRAVFTLRKPFKKRKFASYPDGTLLAVGKEHNDTELFSALCEMRSVKSHHELDTMRKAADIGSRAMEVAMMAAHPGMSEQDLACMFELYSQMNGADFRLPYKPIVAAGANASILHYHPHEVYFTESDMVLCDMGCSVNDYACDISRTFPVSGKFTPEQKVILNN